MFALRTATIRVKASETGTMVQSDEFGSLQRVVDALYADPRIETVRRMDVLVMAEVYDLCSNLCDIVKLLPPGSYTRQKLCNQLNASITGHAWGLMYGTVE